MKQKGKKENYTTSAKQKDIKPITLKDLERMASMTYLQPSVPKRGRFDRIIGKFMNKLGWYRQTTVYVIDNNVFMPKPPIPFNSSDIM